VLALVVHSLIVTILPFSYMLKLYPNTFLGCDFCSWLVSESAGEFRVKNREEAVTCGLAMFHFKVIAQYSILTCKRC
jgi:hypothetical protein